MVVGVNRFVEADEAAPEILAIDPELERMQREKLATIRDQRDQSAVDEALGAVEAAARGDENLLYPMKRALRRLATVGEVSATLERVFGRHQ